MNNWLDRAIERSFRIAFLTIMIIFTCVLWLIAYTLVGLIFGFVKYEDIKSTPKEVICIERKS